ncbi:MAG: hypothetical protein NVSMB51_15890 [Solirubrobacteraceae bacterium]
MPTSHILRAGALTAVALLAGCGTPTHSLTSRVLRLRVDEYSVTPQSIRVHAGRLKIVLRNTGILTHNIRLIEDRRGRNGGRVVLGGTPTAKPGETVTAKIPPEPGRRLKPGRYKLLDTVSNHADLGDYATLIVAG